MKKVVLLTLGLAMAWAESIDLGDVTVTATRSDVNSTDLQASVLKASKEAIETAALQKDVLNNVAGVLVTQTTSGIGHTMSIRTPITTNPRFLYLQDGIPVQSSGFFNHNAMAYTNFLGAGSAEVLKGAGTALYGSDAIAGTINIRTPDAKEHNGTTIEAQGGSFGYAGLAVKHSKKSENGSYYMGASQNHSDGWKAHSAYDRSELTVKKDSVLNDENSVKTILTANSSTAEQTGDLVGLDTLNNQTESLGKLDLSKVDALRKLDFARLSAQWTNFAYDNVEIDTILYGRFNRNRYTATWKSTFPQNDATTATLGIMNKNTFDKKWGKVVVGFDTEYTQGKTLTEQVYEADVNNSIGTIYDYNVNYFAFAPYLQSKGDITKKLKYTAGLRYDYNRFDYVNNTDTGEYDLSGYLRVADRKDDFSHLSPKLSLAYKADDKNLLYLRYANGFRIPQASRLYELSTSNKEFTLNPETTNTYELGYKQKGSNHSFETAIYYMTIDDTIASFTDGSGNKYYDNAETTYHYGIETTLKNKFNDSWASKISHAYSQHRFDKEAAANAGNQMEAAPHVIVNGQIIMTPQSLAGLKLIAEVQSVSSYFMDNANSKSYEGYTIGHLKAFYKVNKAWSLKAKVSNIANVIYAEKASFSFGKELYTAGAPREFMLSASYNW